MKTALLTCLLWLPLSASAASVVLPRGDSAQSIWLLALALLAFGLLVLLPWAVVRTIQRRGVSDEQVNRLLFGLLGYILLITMVNLGVNLSLRALNQGLPWLLLLALTIVNSLRWPVLIIVVALAVARWRSSPIPATGVHMRRHILHAGLYVGLSALLLTLQLLRPGLLPVPLLYAPAAVLAALVAWHYRATLRSSPTVCRRCE